MKDAYSLLFGASAKTTFSYNAAGDLLTEDGPVTGTTDLLTYTYNTARLRTGLTLNQPGGGTFALTYGYDLSRRLTSVTRAGSPNDVFSYTYKPISVGGASYAASLVQQLSLPNSLSIVNDFTDPLQRLISTQFKDSSAVVKNSHSYAYNSGSQRTSHTRGGNGHPYGGTSNYTYDNDGQLATSSLESLTYGYDAGWNMITRNTTSYTVNERNQVTGDGSVSYTYDANGNRTSTSNYRTWTYDDENQLIKVEQSQSWKSEFTYDGRQRLRVRKDYTWNGSTWYPASETRYVYDGMLVIQERTSSHVPLISYTRGQDLSGRLAGAGGIGGLLSRSRHATSNPYAINGNSFYHADGNGNVTYLSAASTNGVADAAYKYDPFGRWLGQSGSYAPANVMRFSSKPWVGHNGSNSDGLYYYGYRFYDPNPQRWLSRDPLAEIGGVNLYAFVRNRPSGAVDSFGLQEQELDHDEFCKAICKEILFWRSVVEKGSSLLSVDAPKMLAGAIAAHKSEGCPPCEEPENKPKPAPVPVCPQVEPVNCQRNNACAHLPGDPVRLDAWLVIGGAYGPLGWVVGPAAYPVLRLRLPKPLPLPQPLPAPLGTPLLQALY
jgi:RHS repeat-associated protein